MEILTVLKNTILPAILVLAGIFFLVLSLIPRTGGKFKLSGRQKIIATAIGIILLLFGISRFLIPNIEGGSGLASAPTILGVTIRENRESGELVILQEINFYDDDGNTNLVERELIDLSDPSQRQYIDIQNSVVDSPPELQKIRARVSEAWYCEGRSYVATLEVLLKDEDGHQSQPVRYTIDCN